MNTNRRVMMLWAMLAALYLLGMVLAACAPQPPARPAASATPAMASSTPQEKVVTARPSALPYTRVSPTQASSTQAPVAPAATQSIARVSPTQAFPAPAPVTSAPVQQSAGASLTQPSPAQAPTQPPAPPADAAGILLRSFAVTDFDALHAPVEGDANRHLIFGNLRVSPPAAGLGPALAAFLGRWEGYDYSPPAPKDLKIVLFVQEITGQGGKAYLWSGTTLQYPLYAGEVAFRVVPGVLPSIEWEVDAYLDVYAPERGTTRVTMALSYAPATHTLRGGARLPGAAAGTAIELGRGASFYVYRDYDKYFADHRVYPKPYQNAALLSAGSGYLVYLPEGYEAQTSAKWPLIFFLIGSGERGSNPYLLAKHGPLKVVLEGEPLPFIVVAPMLNAATSFRSFPETYLDGALDEILATYRVDRRRVYLTGISMGGEATYRFALYRPEAFAALAPMAGFNAKYNPGARREGFLPFPSSMDGIKDIPTWVVHGAADPIVPLSVARRTVDDLEHAGGNVKFTVLPDHGHDVWTDTYADPVFFEWLLGHERP